MSTEVAVAEHATYVRRAVDQREVLAAKRRARELSDEELVRLAIGGAAAVGPFYGAPEGLCAEPREALACLERELLRRLSSMG